MTVMAQPLGIRFRIRSARFNRDDVIPLSSEPYSPLLLTFNAQRLSLK